MNQNKITNLFGFTGAFLLIIAVFCPVVNMPFEGSISFINRWLFSGIILIFLSFLSGVLSFFGKSRYLWLPSFVLGIISLYHLYDLNQKMNQYSFGNSFFRANVKSFMSFEWGWFLLFGSIIMLLLSSILSHNVNKR